MEEEERICRNCGRNCTELGGWYHESGEYHCDDCHSLLYSDEEWAKLCEEDDSEFYWTE